MREIKHIVIHCTATPQGAKVASIQRYWREVLKWKSPGYHVIIDKDGTVTRLAPDEAICNGVAGFNRNALHVSYIGGVDAKGKPIDNRTDAQKAALYFFVRGWAAKYPDAKIMGHCDFPKVAKACPCFDVREWCERVGFKHNR